MEFSVPQFIEMETKIVGPLTWRQFIYIGGAGALIFFLYFIIEYFYLFLVVAIFLFASAASLAFLKIKGHPLPTIIVNFFLFSLSSKLYIWRKKPIKAGLFYRKEKIRFKKEKPEESVLLKITKESRLKDLSTQIELKTK